jgi:hypothetical protein
LKFTPEDFPEGTDERISRFYSDFGAVTGEGRVGYTTWTFWPADADVQLWQEIENVWYDELAVRRLSLPTTKCYGTKLVRLAVCLRSQLGN